MNPSIYIDLEKLKYNVIRIKERCNNFELMAVLKGIDSNEEIMKIFYNSNILKYGETSIESIKKLRSRYGRNIDISFLRTPMESEIEEVALLCDEVLVSHETKIEKLLKINDKLRITIMVDIGDNREGISLDKIKEIIKIKEKIYAIGAVKGCLTEIKPQIEDIELLIRIRDKIDKNIKISIGGTYFFDILENIKEKGIVLRAGEIFLTGKNPLSTSNINWSDLRKDIFTIRCEIIEINTREINNKQRKMALCVAGNNFFNPNKMVSYDIKAFVEGYTSEHMVIDITESKINYKVGECIEFLPNYLNLSTFFKGICKKNLFFSTF